MIPVLVLAIATALARLAGQAGIAALADWRSAMRVGVAVMFVFTGATHFTEMKHDYAAMVPPPLTGELSVIYLTGLLEIAGALGLLWRRTQRLAGICLFLLLLALFPANVYAAMQDVQFRGAPPTDLWLRAVIQVVFLLAVWWSAIRRHAGGASETPLQPAGARS